MDKKYIIICKAKVARELLKLGETIVDIKPHREVKNATVFVFKATDFIWEYLRKQKKEKESK